MSVRTIEASTIKLSQIQSPDGQPAITVSNSGVVSLVAPSGDAGNEIASTTYVQEAIANASGTLSLNTTGSYEWTGSYNVFNNDQIITIGNNLTVPPTLPVLGETCLANQIGVQIENSVYGDNETDFLNYGGDQVGGFSFSTITDTYPLKQNLEITNNGSATILNVLGVGSDIQVNSASVLVPNPASQTLPNTFTDVNTFTDSTIFDNDVTLNDPVAVNDIMTFAPNTIKLVNPTYATGIGQVLLGPQGNIQLLNNQSTKGVTIQSGTYATSMLVDNLQNLNLNNGLVVTGNASANNITSANNISTATLTVSGIGTAPTAPISTNTTQLATCEFVQQNKAISSGANVNLPNTFTATQNFQANTTYPTNMIFSSATQIPTATITYDNDNLTIDTPDSLIISNTLNGGSEATLQPYALGLNLNGTPLINQATLNTALIPYIQTTTANATYAQLTGATFTGSISTTGGISATSGKINGFPIVTSNNLTPALTNYALLSSADFLGAISAPTISSTGAISASSGTLGGFPIATSSTLTGFASKTADNNFTGVNAFNPPSMPASVLAGPSNGAGVSIYWNTAAGSGATDLLCNGNGGGGGLNIWANNQTTNPPAIVATFVPSGSTVNGTLTTTDILQTPYINIKNSAGQVVPLSCQSQSVLRVEGNVSCNGVDVLAVSTGSISATGTTTLSGASTCPTVTINDPTSTSIVNEASLISYVTNIPAVNPYFVGQLISGMFPTNASNLINAGFLFCNGAPYDSTDPRYAPLYAVIGGSYGANGQYFNVPNMQARMPFGGNGDLGTPKVPCYTDTSTTRNIQYTGTYGGIIETSDQPNHYHPINDTGHFHPCYTNYNQAQPHNNPADACMKWESQDNAPFAMNTNSAFTGITQTEQIGEGLTIGYLSQYCAVNWFIYAGPP